MKTAIRYVLILILALTSTDAFCQNPMKQLHFINPNKKSMTLRFKFINNLIIIPVSINNSDTLNFILDTGLTTSLITELGYQDSLMLNYAQNIELQGLGSGEPLQAIHTFGNDIRIKDIEGKNQDFYVLRQNIFHLSSKLGMEINGILGYSIFENFVVGINYNHKTITFYNPEFENYKRKEKRYSSIPLTLHDTKPYITLQVVDSRGNVFDVKMLLDTGASHALWLNRNSLPSMMVPEKQRYTYLGSGLNGDIHGIITRMNQVKMAGYELDNVIVSFPDSASIAHAIGLDRRNGSLGSEILKRFNIIINYPDKKISIRKNSFFKSKFTENLSGMEIIAPIPELHAYMVDDIRKGSPAEEAGMEKGDILLSVNGVPVKKLTLNEIYQVLQSKPGRRVRIEYRRGKEQHKVKIVLENFI